MEFHLLIGVFLSWQPELYSESSSLSLYPEVHSLLSLLELSHFQAQHWDI